VKRLLDDLTRLNPVSRGLLLPDGEAGPLDTVKRVLGFIPSWIETFSARTEKMRALLAGDFLEKFGRCEGFRTLFSEIDVRSRLSEREPLNQSLYLWAKTVRVANDQILMLITSACVLNERYGLAA